MNSNFLLDQLLNEVAAEQGIDLDESKEVPEYLIHDLAKQRAELIQAYNMSLHTENPLNYEAEEKKLFAAFDKTISEYEPKKGDVMIKLSRRQEARNKIRYNNGDMDDSMFELVEPSRRIIK